MIEQLTGGIAHEIEVAPPYIAGDTVKFAWTQSPENLSQRRNRWVVRYPGLDLAMFDPRLFLEIFLGLQLGVWSRLEGRIRLRLPFPLPEDSVRLWCDYHRVRSIECAPLSATAEYDPLRASPLQEQVPRPNAVFYTGGRDSSVTASILAELEGADRLLLLSLSEPLRDRPMHDSFPGGTPPHLPGAGTAVACTDYRAGIVRERKSFGPHLEFYWLVGLPSLLAHGATLATTAHEIDSYRVVDYPDGRREFDFRRSRPEWLAGIAGHLRRTLGFGIQLTDIAWPLSQTLTHRLLTQRYPSSPSPASCRPLPEGGWCMNCVKCARQLLSTLAVDSPDATFDYDRILTRSRYIARALTAIEPLSATSNGNVPWTPEFTADWEFDEWCHWLSIMRPERTVPYLSVDAARRLDSLRAAYGNAANPQHDQWSPRSLEAIPARLRDGYRMILADRFTSVDELPPIFLPDGGAMRPGWAAVDTPPPALAAAARFAT